MNESLLKTIDSIDDIVMESETSVLLALEAEYSKAMMICEYCEPDVATYIMETDAPESAPKKDNIFKKAGRLIMSLLRAIKDKAVAIFNKITNNRFSKDMKGVKGTPSQALAKAKSNKGKNNVYTVLDTDFFTFSIDNNGKPFYHHDSKESWKALLGGGYIETPILKVLLKKRYRGDVRGVSAGAVLGIGLMDYYNKNKNDINSLVFNTVSLLQKISSDPNGNYDKEVNKLEDEFFKFQNGKPVSFITGTIDFYPEDLKNISSGVTDCMNKLPDITKIPQFDYTDTNLNTLKDIYNTLIQFFTQMQMGLNLAYKKCKVDFVLDEIEQNTCGMKELDLFIEELMNYNYPEKYIHKLVYQAAKNELKDGCKEAKWGQFRGCLIPKNEDIVYKYALCPKGKLDNKNERAIYRKFEEENLSTKKYLCRYIDYSPNYNIISMEKIKFNSRKANKVLADIINEIDAELKDKHIDIKIGDIHYQNIGFRKDNTPVIADYGTASAEQPDHIVLKILGKGIAM